MLDLVRMAARLRRHFPAIAILAATASSGCASLLVSTTGTARVVRQELDAAEANIQVPHGHLHLKATRRSERALLVELKNEGTSSAAVDWERLAFVDRNGAAHELVPTEATDRAVLIDAGKTAALSVTAQPLPSAKGPVAIDAFALPEEALRTEKGVFSLGTIYFPLLIDGQSFTLRAPLQSSRHPVEESFECRLSTPLPAAERTWCGLTFWAAGGACWSLLAHPNREDNASVKVATRGLLQNDPTDSVEITLLRIRGTGYSPTGDGDTKAPACTTSSATTVR